MAKITFIGAGSIVFAKNLLIDILSFPELSRSTITLMDINPEKLELITKMARKMVVQEGFKAVIEATTDRRQALLNANYVITMIQVGGMEAFETDIKIPEKYGISQAVGDTLGPGGIFRGLRTIPVLLDIGRDMEELCPDALLLNYANPMAINCWALNKGTGIKNVGLCHSVQGTAESLAEYTGVPIEEVSFKCAGINHNCWFLEYKWRGRDMYPAIREKYNDPDVYNKDITKFELLKYFGHFVTESSYHISEYLSYFRKDRYWIDKIKGINSWLKEDEGLYFEHCRKRAATFQEDMNRIINAEKIDVMRSHEYASHIIYAMETGNPEVIYGNVENRGLISNLPEGCCVEVPCLIDKNGVQPTFIGMLPTQIAALVRTNISVQELTVEGSLSGNKDAIYHAAAMDPLTSASLTLPDIHNMVSEMFEAEKLYLPQFN